MVKKITGTTPSRGTAAAGGVKSAQEVQTAKEVSGVDQIGSVKPRQQAGRTRGATRPMSAEEREHLMRLVDEEANRLLANSTLTEGKRQTIAESVKMTIAAGFLDDDEE